ncbi:PHP domain-containing protein [Paenibacillus xanthanilyticus]|uniref:PHP domain-containing protein n=1 Tax=Paenibacillus xanthanilyticus TaxID=1783531 RepID=A0ABV8K4P4_9BACL
MAVNLADLHTHTTASDGLQRPADNVRMAKAAGLAAIGITDHDTVDGIEEAVNEGERLGIAVVPGVEISTFAEGCDIHILGYYTDWRSDRWREKLGTLLNGRNRRNELILEKLGKLGIAITMADVIAEARRAGKDSGTIGRPHIAAVLVARGEVGSTQEAFEKYLAAGAQAYASAPRLSPFEALEWIREAGGTSVIAHPGIYGNDALVEAIIRAGAEGIEVYHSDHTSEDEAKYGKLASQYGLIVTGGSDFHGVRAGEDVFHGPIGHRTVEAAVLRQLNPAWRI